MMETEFYRLSSFSQFPKDIPIYVTKLAREGFFYTGNNAIVQCKSCAFQYKNWLSSACIWKMHKEYSPDCVIASQRTLDQPQQTTPSQTSSPDYDKRETSDNKTETTQNTEKQEENLNFVVNSRTYNNQTNSKHRAEEIDGHDTLTTVNSDAYIKVDRARYPDFSDVSRRIATYKNWPSDLQQKPYDLALAGFFYTGNIIICFIFSIYIRTIC